MQERIGLRALDLVIARERRFHIAQHVVVFGMVADPVGRHGLQWRQDLVGALLAVGFAEKAAHIVGRWIKHGAIVPLAEERQAARLVR